MKLTSIFSLVGTTTCLTMCFTFYGTCEEQSVPAVVIDGWWSSDYAKNGCEHARSFVNENRSLINQFGCEAVTACTDVMPRFAACTAGLEPAVQAGQFEDRLM